MTEGSQGGRRLEGRSAREGGALSVAPSCRLSVYVGVDPGGRSTGLVVRCSTEPLWAALETRDGNESLPGAIYVGEVLRALDRALEVAAQETSGNVIVAVEGLNPPTAHMGMTNPAGVIGTGIVFGAVLGYLDTPIVVPPNHHGTGPREAYPPALWGVKERKGGGRFQHVRAAWDVSLAAVAILRAEES